MGSLERFLNTAHGLNFLELPFDKGSATTVFFQTASNRTVSRQYCMVVPGQGGAEVFLADMSCQPHLSLRKARLVRFRHSLLSGHKWAGCIQAGATVHIEFRRLYMWHSGSTAAIIPGSICAVPYVPMREFDSLYRTYLENVRNRPAAVPPPQEALRPPGQPTTSNPARLLLPVPDVEEIGVTIPDRNQNVPEVSVEADPPSAALDTTLFLDNLRVDAPETYWTGPGPDPRRQVALPHPPVSPAQLPEATRPMVLARRPASMPESTAPEEVEVSAYIADEYPPDMGRILLMMYGTAMHKGLARSWLAMLKEMTRTCWDRTPKEERDYRPGDASIRTFLSYLAERAGTSLEDILWTIHKRGAGAE